MRPPRTHSVTGSSRGRRCPVSGRAAATVRAAILVIVLGVAASLAGPSLPVLAAAPQPAQAPAAAAAEQAGGEAGGSAHEGASPWALVARLFNFALLAGTLVYFLRSPFVAFLARRGSEIRSSLIRAAELREKSANQLAELDRRLAALPAEIEALRTRGTADVAAEEARILAAADADRARLVEQARREVDFQVRVARRELVAHAADLAVAVASERIRKTIGDDDQRRLVEAYLSQVRAAPRPGAAGLPAGGQP